MAVRMTEAGLWRLALRAQAVMMMAVPLPKAKRRALHKLPKMATVALQSQDDSEKCFTASMTCQPIPQRCYRGVYHALTVPHTDMVPSSASCLASRAAAAASASASAWWAATEAFLLPGERAVM